MKKIKVVKFDNFIFEQSGSGDVAAGGGGGVAYTTLNMNGMGNVVAPQASSIPGYVGGSTIGSGDLPAYNTGKKFQSITGPKKGKKGKKSKRVRFYTKIS